MAPSPSNSHDNTKNQTQSFLIMLKKRIIDMKSHICAMQEEHHEFERLEVLGTLFLLLKAFVITLKVIYKVKLDEIREVETISTPVAISVDYRQSRIPRTYSRLRGSNSITSIEKAGTTNMISQYPRGIFIHQSKQALESLTKYGLKSCDLPEDTPMVAKSKTG
ncbi:hypothetical protein Tco_1041104 [Tanacetum coccineum]|uniref:Uncharacterized protein n=1 Tax=Tanacetum coccineum TaxID=301880 RepID=A0ABQ5GFU2_9ASTR